MSRYSKLRDAMQSKAKKVANLVIDHSLDIADSTTEQLNQFVKHLKDQKNPNSTTQPIETPDLDYASDHDALQQTPPHDDL